MDIYQSAIKHQMEKWSRYKGVEIDLGMYLEEDNLKAITQLQFSPAGGGAGMSLAQLEDKSLFI